MNVRRVLSALYLLGLCLGVAAAAWRPVAFQKSNSIRIVRGPIPGIEVPDGVEPLDVYGLLSEMPRSDLSMVWSVDPDVKFEKTIRGGRGNCSNQVFGLARMLELEGLDYQIFHFMRPSKVLSGKGHTVIRTRYRLARDARVGLVDIFAGGLPRSGAHFLDIYDLFRGPVANFSFLSWNGYPDKARRFYQEFLSRVILGWIPAREVAEYFDFIEAVYVPFGSRRLEKYVYDGLAVVLGYYPEIHVSDSSPISLLNPLEWPFYIGVLWLLRSAFVGVPLVVALELWSRRRRAGR